MIHWQYVSLPCSPGPSPMRPLSAVSRWRSRRQAPAATAAQQSSAAADHGSRRRGHMARGQGYRPGLRLEQRTVQIRRVVHGTTDGAGQQDSRLEQWTVQASGDVYLNTEWLPSVMISGMLRFEVGL